MYLSDAAILGAIQGITEFLPVSSTGHVEICSRLFHLHDFSRNFNIIINLGTLSAIALYFCKDVLKILLGGIDWIFNRKTVNRKIFSMIMVANLPTIFIFGILEFLSLVPDGSELIFGLNLIIFGLILHVCDKNESENKDFSMPDAIKVGLAQLLSIFAGVSRLGICISTCRYLKYSRQNSFKFCILFSIIPAAGACVLKLLKIVLSSNCAANEVYFSCTEMFIGIVSAFLFGFVSLHIIYKFLKSHTFLPFIMYRIILGIFILIFVFLNKN